MSPPPPGTPSAVSGILARKPVVIFTAALILAAIVFGLRFSQRLTIPQIRDEDGYIFFQEDALLEWGAFITPYNGFLHTLQRSVAAIGGYFHPRWTPWIFNWLTLFLTAAVVARIAVARIPPAWRFAFGALLLLHPLCHWQAIHLTNIMWFTAALLPVLAIEEAPRTRLGAGATLATVGICGLSGPFSLIFAPLFVLRALWLDRSRYSFALLGTVILAAGAQLLAFAGGTRDHLIRKWELPEPGETWELTNRFLVHSFFGKFADTGSATQSALAIVVLLLFGIGMGTAFGKGTSREQLFRLGILATGMALAYGAGVFGSPVPWHEVWPSIANSRYYILPYLFFAWLLVALACLPRTRWAWLRAPALLLLVAGALTRFHSGPLPPSLWERDLQAMETKTYGMLRLHPPGKDYHVFMARGQGRHGFARGEELRQILDVHKLMERLFGIEIESYEALLSDRFMFPETVGNETGLLLYPRTTFTLPVPPGATAFSGNYGYSSLAVPPDSGDQVAGGDGFLVKIAVTKRLEPGRQKYVPVKREEIFKPAPVTTPRRMRPFRFTFEPGEWDLVIIQVSGGRIGEPDVNYDFSLWTRLAFEFSKGLLPQHGGSDRGPKAREEPK